jgi:hypothetical protein
MQKGNMKDNTSTTCPPSAEGGRRTLGDHSATIPVCRRNAVHGNSGTPGIVPVVIQKNGLFFSAGEVSPADYAMLEQTIHAPMTLHRSTPLRVRIVSEYCAEHPKHPRVYPIETYLDHGNSDDYRKSADPKWDSERPESRVYPLRGFVIMQASNNAVVVRRVRPEAGL